MSSPFQHQCSPRADQNSIWTTFANYWLLPTHFISSIALAVVLLAQVNGRLFLVGTTSRDAPPLVVPIFQTSVTTLLSVSIVVVRALAGTWLTLTGWRLAFIMLEYTGTTLQGFSRLVRYRLPPRDSGFTPLFGALLIIFVISVPVQFVSPILTGAVSWIPDLAMSASQVVNVTHAGETRTGWYYHQTFENDRFRETMQALAHTSLATTANFSDSSERIVRRRIPSLQEFPADSRLDEIAMPYLEIKSLDWIHSKDEIPLSYLYLLTNITNNDTFPLSMTPSELRNPYFHGGDPGRVTIAFPGKWKGTIKYPQSQIVNGSYYVIVSRFGRTACNVSEPDVPTFGPLESLYHLQSFTGPNRFDDSRNEACFVIARLEYAAGVVTCRNCSLSAGGIIEKTLGTESLEPDPVAEQALRMTPDVLALMSVTQNWQSWILPGSLDAYTRNMLTVAYQASWNSMANYWANDTTAVQTELKSPFPALKADIAIWRVWTWLALNCLLTVSGLIVAALQWKTAAKTVCNPELSALLLDTRQVIEKGASGLCNAVKLQKQDKGLRMRLRFQDGREASHWHPYLEAEDTAVYTGVSQEYLLEEIAHAPNK